MIQFNVEMKQFQIQCNKVVVKSALDDEQETKGKKKKKKKK
jgi:hypothetical protein